MATPPQCDTPFAIASEQPSCFDDAHFFGIGVTLHHLVSTLSPYLAKPKTRKP